MSYSEFLVYFYLKNHARVVKFSYLNFAPDFLKANYFARPNFLLENFAQVKGHKKPKKIKEMTQKW